MATKDFPVHSPRVSINPKGCRFIDHKMYARLFIFSHSFRSLFCYFHYIFLWPCCWICCHSSIRCIGFDSLSWFRCSLAKLSFKLTALSRQFYSLWLFPMALATLNFHWHIL